jgi:hypothetical protein
VNKAKKRGRGVAQPRPVVALAGRSRTRALEIFEAANGEWSPESLLESLLESPVTAQLEEASRAGF